jgi:hypothetical protein
MAKYERLERSHLRDPRYCEVTARARGNRNGQRKHRTLRNVAGVLCVAAACTAAPTALVTAGGVKSEPSARGDVSLEQRRCLTTRDADATTTRCKYTYTIEADHAGTSKGYRAEWRQIAVTPRAGYCVARIFGVVSVEEAQLVSWSQTQARTNGQARRWARLTVPSRARPSAILRQALVLRRGAISVRPSATPEGDEVRWRWRGGRGHRTVRVAVGGAFAPPSGSEQYVLTRDLTEVEIVRCSSDHGRMRTPLRRRFADRRGETRAGQEHERPSAQRARQSDRLSSVVRDG